MHIPIQATNHVHFVIMVHWLRTEELLRLLKATLQSFDLVGLGAIFEAIGNPALVSAENHHLRIRDGK